MRKRDDWQRCKVVYMYKGHACRQGAARLGKSLMVIAAQA